MKTKHIASLLAVVLALAMLAPAVYADKGKDGHGKKEATAVRGIDEVFFHKASLILKCTKRLGLSDEQEAKIHDVKREAKKALIGKKANAKIVQIDIMAELYKDKPDAKKVNELIAKKYEIKKSLAVALADSFIALKSILTEEQWDKLKEIKKLGSHKKHEGSGTK
jgi:Spy/CpxP family protein refolding chaperone